MIHVAKLIGEIKALGLSGDAMVLVLSASGLHAVFQVERELPMVRVYNSGLAPYVFGRKNARRHVCLEVNLANYPSIKQARADACTVSALLSRLQTCLNDGLKSAGDSVDVLARAESKRSMANAPTYLPVQSVSAGQVPISGRLALQSRGGTRALILGV
jgi:hypothetical protein